MLPKIDIILPQPYDTISQSVEIRQMEPWMQIITAIYNHMTTKRKTDHLWLTGFIPSTPQSRVDPGPHGQPIRKEKADRSVGHLMHDCHTAAGDEWELQL
jgi:hypothetical protein